MYQIAKRRITAVCWLAVSVAMLRASSSSLTVVSAVVNPSTQQITIKGTDLTPTSGLPAVTLGGTTLTVVSAIHQKIVATMPSGLPPGSYQLTVNNGTASVVFDVTYGSDGPLTLPFSGTASSADYPALSITNAKYQQPAIWATGGAVPAGAPEGSGWGLISFGGDSNGSGSGGAEYAGVGVYANGGYANGTTDVGGVGLEAVGGQADTPTSYPGPGVAALGGGFASGISGSVNAGNGMETYGGAGSSADTSGNGIFAEPGWEGAPGNLSLLTNFAGLFDGDVDVSGALSKSGGSFKIDHPLDPANKYLLHSFVESPDMMNIYNGNVTTDGSGSAVVTMPAWFEALNSDFRYQLTVIGQFARAIVGSEISNGSFTIKTDKPNVKVSWQVTGIRQDAWANAHRIPVEVAKAPQDQGRYLHPELFGHQGEPSIPASRHRRPAQR
jgi:hypothetical protein